MPTTLRHARPSRLAILSLVAAVLGGCGGGGSDQASTPDAAQTTGGETTRVDADTGATTTVEPAGDRPESVPEGRGAVDPGPGRAAVYFTAGEQFRPVERDVGGSHPLAATTEELIEGPTRIERRRDVRSAIPPGVELREVNVDDEGTAVVEVSEDFLAGIPRNPSRRSPGQRSDVNARLAQVTYTTTQFDGVDETRVVAGGIPVEPASDRGDFAKPETGPRPIRKAEGERVPGTRSVQRKLARMRYLPYSAVDGLNGYRTRQAVIAFQSWNGLARDGIVGPQTAAALRSATTPDPSASGPNRRIEVHRARGVALLISRGEVRRAIHVSSGAPGYATPTGSYHVFRKEERSWSYPYSVWLPWASYFNNGIAFHEWANVPPYPASHGCVRVPVPESQIVYRFAGIGTPVLVF